MTRVNLSTTLPVSARTVWDAIGGFNSLAKWHPAVAKSEEAKEGTATIRRLTLRDGSTIVERLEGKDDKKRDIHLFDSLGTATGRRLQGESPCGGEQGREELHR